MMKTSAIGYGMGKKDFPRANCVRVMIGETGAAGDSIVVPGDSIVVPGDSIVVPNDSIEVPTDTVKVDDGTLVNVPAKATFAFNLGTAGQVATFGTWGDYFISSNVTLGSNLIIKGTDEKGLGQTLIEPKELQQGEESGSAADESNAIRFLFKPKNGITFTPTKVSLKATSYETDDGLLDFSWSTSIILRANRLVFQILSSRETLTAKRKRKEFPYSTISYTTVRSIPEKDSSAMAMRPLLL